MSEKAGSYSKLSGYSVAIDLDGVLANFIDNFNDLLKSRDEDEAWDYIKTNESFWLALEPMVNKDEIKAINSLAAYTQFYVVTSRVEGISYNVAATSSTWLARQGLKGLNTIVIPKQKKIELLPLIGVFAYLDDMPKNLESMYDKLVDIAPVNPVICYLKNNEFPLKTEDENILTVTSVEEYLNRIYETVAANYEVEQKQEESGEEGWDVTNDK